MSDIQTVAAEAAASGSQNTAQWCLSVDGQTESYDTACHETVQKKKHRILKQRI